MDGVGCRWKGEHVLNLAPKHPRLVAGLICTAFVALLCWPIARGMYLVSTVSDQYAVGYAFREFGARYFAEHGGVAQWNPYIFGGLPFVAAQHGDIFYPTALLRLLVSTDMALNLAFAVHLVLAGFFTFLFLRAVGLPWIAATGGGLAYQLTGQVASLVHPGHDGKIFASALLPLGFLALLRAIRDGRLWGYGVWAVVVGLAVLAHPQLCYYLLIAAGLFALYLTFWDDQRSGSWPWWGRLGAALAGVALGLGIAAIQVVPFAAYIPFSPRTVPGAFSGWDYATSWSMPPEELLNVVVPQFTGLVDAYWGRNFFKLHTEYIGVAVLALAVLGWGNAERRRLRWGLAAIGGFMLIVSLGGHTPIYRLLYLVLPGVRLLRAPSMAFYLVVFVTALLAAFGIERALQEPERALRHAAIWTAALAAAVVFAIAGIWTSLGESIADPQRLAAVRDNQPALVLGTIRALAVAAGLAALLYAMVKLRLRPAVAGGLLLVVIGLDLWSVARRFFVFSPPAPDVYVSDEVLDTLRAQPKPFRVWDAGGSYRDGSLMIFEVSDAVGHHGNEIRFYDALLGGKNNWQFLRTGNRKLWRELGLTHLILPDTLDLPGWRRVVGPVQTFSGGVAYLYESTEPVPYAQVVPAAVKLADADILPTFYDERLDPRQILLLPDDAPVEPAPLDGIPTPTEARAEFVLWEPGRMRIRIDPPPKAPAYLRVSETYYPDWRATVDGAPVPVLRGQYALLAVPLAEGASEVELVFESDRYTLGRLLTIVSLAVAGVWIVAPVVIARRRDG
jgi:hypothetical protein